MAEEREQRELRGLTSNARRMAELLEETETRGNDILAIALARSRDRILRILLRNLRSAIAATKEFEYTPLKAQLIEVFSNPEIIYATRQGRVLIDADGIAGTTSELFDGIEAARDILNLSAGGKLTKEQRLEFWTTFVYLPARAPGNPAPESIKKGKKKSFSKRGRHFYARTIEARLVAWGGLAPYWHFLENGTGEGAFPRFQGTSFVKRSQEEAQQLFDRTLQVVNQDVENVIFREVQALESNPEGAVPGRELNRFFLEGREFLIYITPTRRVGVRLAR